LDIDSDERLDKSSNYSEEVFMACYGNVSGNSKNTWRTGLKLHNDEHIISSSVSSHYASNRHQVYAIINDISKEFDEDNNPIISPQNPTRGANHRAEGEIESAVAKGESSSLNGRMAVTMAQLPANLTREVLMGYQYTSQPALQAERICDDDMLIKPISRHRSKSIGIKKNREGFIGRKMKVYKKPISSQSTTVRTRVYEPRKKIAR
jgi:hypothetical protein